MGSSQSSHPRRPLGPSDPLPCQRLDLHDVPLLLLGHLLFQGVDLLPECRGMLHLPVKQVPQRPGKRGPVRSDAISRARGVRTQSFTLSPKPSVLHKGLRNPESRVRDLQRSQTLLQGLGARSTWPRPRAPHNTYAAPVKGQQGAQRIPGPFRGIPHQGAACLGRPL